MHSQALRWLLKLPIYSAIMASIILALWSGRVAAQNTIHLQTIEEFDHFGKPLPLAKASVKLLRFIEKDLHVHIEVKRVPWKRAMNNALAKDILLMGMSITSERKKSYLFSDPINANANWLVTRCDATFRFEQIEDLKSKLIGAVLGTSAGEEFDAQINTLFRIENDTGAGISRLQKLMAKRMDALVWYGITSTHQEMQAEINHNYVSQKLPNNTGTSAPFCVLPHPISIVNNHFAMRINDDNLQLLERINQAMLKGRKTGAIPPVHTTNLN